MSETDQASHTDRFTDPEAVLEQTPLAEGDTVVDLGSGIGGFAIPAAQRVGKAGSVYAVDMREQALTRLANIAQRDYALDTITTIWGDIDEPGGTELPDSTAHFAILANVLPFLDAPQVAAGELCRVLVPGGRALVVDWHESFSGMGPQPDQIVAEGEARKLFEHAACDIEESVDVGPYQYGFIIRKAP